MSNQDEDWLTIREAADRLKVSDLTIRRRIKDGRIVHRLVEGKYYVNLEAAPPQNGSPPAEVRGPVEAATTAAEPGVRGVLEVQSLLPEYARLAEQAGKASVLSDQLQQLERRFVELQQSSLILATRNGWLESKLEEREREVKLLTDSRVRRPWWKKLFGGKQGATSS